MADCLSEVVVDVLDVTWLNDLQDYCFSAHYGDLWGHCNFRL